MVEEILLERVGGEQSGGKINDIRSVYRYIAASRREKSSSSFGRRMNLRIIGTNGYSILFRSEFTSIVNVKSATSAHVLNIIFRDDKRYRRRLRGGNFLGKLHSKFIML